MMMTGPKAIFCIDIDGTLIDSQEQIHPNDVKLLKHFPREIQLVITTGRILHSAKGVLRENGLFTDLHFPLPGVFMNGGVAYLPKEKLCVQHSFTKDIRQVLLALPKSFPETAFMFFTISGVYLVNPTLFGHHISRLHYLEARDAKPEEIPDRIIKVMVLEENTQILNQIKVKTLVWDAEMAFSLPFAYEINPPNVTKANTLSKLLKTMGLKELPVFVVGDGENDLSPPPQLTQLYLIGQTTLSNVKIRDYWNRSCLR
jgi:HAD superfamily hydrolase (TIGR01484 family)